MAHSNANRGAPRVFLRPGVFAPLLCLRSGKKSPNQRHFFRMPWLSTRPSGTAQGPGDSALLFLRCYQLSPARHGPCEASCARPSRPPWWCIAAAVGHLLRFSGLHFTAARRLAPIRRRITAGLRPDLCAPFVARRGEVRHGRAEPRGLTSTLTVNPHGPPLRRRQPRRP